MTIEIAILGTILGGFLGLAGWLATRDKKIETNATWRGEVSAKLDLIVGIKNDMSGLGTRLGKLENRVTTLEAISDIEKDKK